ncbi:DUF5709 domain-containing protein [Spelaeicoccus albus]|uniref:DUF5709 domain-containing protein n=1 Tax=Spelaeicoccus albus TaxID=1280376 RepID=A0A7Z0D3U7_9MICO|nr:DUF5709 domain-containing protein [Spelaeicoccus albus]NYI68379.1 hypothetical protein [Spelaeicoccus albus]
MTEPNETNEYVAEPDSNQLPEEDTLVDRGLDDALDEGVSPPEKPSEPMREGFTASEEREGETLDERVEREQPDDWADPASDDDSVGGEVGDTRAGRLTDNSGIGDETDDDVIATDVGIDGGAAGAEEAAVHVVNPDDDAD